MPKIFYTKRDIEDLFQNGVTTLVINDDIVVTDLGREAAERLGVELVREQDQPSSAPVRPYITEKTSPSVEKAQTNQPGSLPQENLEERVFQAVKAKVGNDVDPELLRMIIQRVLKNTGGT